MAMGRTHATGRPLKFANAVVLLVEICLWLCASAQRQISADTALHEVFSLKAGTCRKFKIGSSLPERQTYYVHAVVTAASVRRHCFCAARYCDTKPDMR